MPQHMVWTPADVHNDQRKLQDFVERLGLNRYDPKEYSEWEKVLLTSEIWNLLKSACPELNVRSDEIDVTKHTALTVLQVKLRDAGLLKPPKPRIKLNAHDYHRYEEWLDYGNLLFPKCMRLPWQALVAEEFGIDQPMIIETEDCCCQGGDEHILALQDRVVQKMSSLWVWGRGHDLSHLPAFLKFVEQYHKHRTMSLSVMNTISSI